MAFKYYAFIVSWVHFLRLVSFGHAALDPQYLGCFLNQDLNISNYMNASSVPLPPIACLAECHRQNYTFAALNNSTCHCTNNYYSKLMTVLDDNCNVSCASNASNECQMYLKMFKTQNTSEESYPKAIYMGCYGEIEGDDKNRLLKFVHDDDPYNTPQRCSEKCFKTGFLYSGTTYGKKEGSACWCGNQHPAKRFKVTDSKCSHHCPNETTKFCGGAWKLSLYSTGIVDYPLGNLVGCFKLVENDRSNDKIYDIIQYADSHRCFYICNERGYKYAEVNEEKCMCTNDPPRKNDKNIPGECNVCVKDESEYCGGSSSISVYENTWLGTEHGNLSKFHFGCFKSFWMYPVMDGWNVSFPQGLTSQICVSNCYSKGFPYAALVSSEDCLCSFDSPSVEAAVVAHHHCDRVCGGGGPNGTTRECGDRSHYNVFATGLRTSRAAGDRYLGCYDDGDFAPNEQTASVDRHSHNTPALCSKHCDRAGFGYFGVSNRATCRCGNAAPDVRSRTGDGSCSAQCTGNANKFCGGLSKTAWFRKGFIADVLQNCLKSCDCHYLPKYNVSRINCSKRNLKELDKTTLISDITPLYVELVLKDNFIEVQPNLTNLNNIILLDIGNISIRRLDVNLLPKSLKVLYIDNNKLTSLDNYASLSLFHNLDRLKLSNNPWSCDCNLKIFLKYKSKIEDFNDITCSSSNLRLIDMNENDLCKNMLTIYFYTSIVMSFLLFVCVLSVYFNLHKTVWLYFRNVPCKSCDITMVETDDSKTDASVTFMQRIQYSELVLATDNWNQNNILGEGGFGTVYKGNWRHTDVAIKRLKSEGVAEKVVNMHTIIGDQFLNPSKEIKFLNAIKHDNILSMYGFCCYSTGSCLIYQYMANGSLEDRLQRKNGTKPLSWLTRGNIAMGTARGLQFLHNLEVPLIHGDIKSANILLDANLEPRIGDFGLARTGPLEEVNKNVGFDVSHVCGTKPYLPDDFCLNKKLSPKVDTYSFGVVMFEIATGLRAFNRYKSYKYLKDFVNKHDKSRLSDIAEKNAGEDLFNIFEALIHLGKSCVANKANDRPEMVVVYTNLHKVMSSKNTEPKIAANGTNSPPSINTDLEKLKGRKAALLAPLHEIPSISNLYSNAVREYDSRKIITVEEKFADNEISVCFNGFKYSKF